MVNAVDGNLPVDRLLKRPEAVLELLEEVVAQTFLGRHRAVRRGQLTGSGSEHVLQNREGRVRIRRVLPDAEGVRVERCGLGSVVRGNGGDVPVVASAAQAIR